MEKDKRQWHIFTIILQLMLTVHSTNKTNLKVLKNNDIFDFII